MDHWPVQAEVGFAISGNQGPRDLPEDGKKTAGEEVADDAVAAPLNAKGRDDEAEELDENDSRIHHG